MASRYSDVLSPASGRHPAEASRRSPWIRRWAWLGIAAQVVFVAGVLVAASWQGPHYSVLRDSISDMYTVTAPHGTFLVQLLTDTGAATILFALLAVWPALRSGGRAAAIGSVLLVLACFFLAHAMARIPGWQAWARPTRATAVLIIALTFADALTEHTGVYGLFERMVAATMAVALTALGIGILRRSRPKGAQI